MTKQRSGRTKHAEHERDKQQRQVLFPSISLSLPSCTSSSYFFFGRVGVLLFSSENNRLTMCNTESFRLSFVPCGITIIFIVFYLAVRRLFCWVLLYPPSLVSSTLLHIALLP